MERISGVALTALLLAVAGCQTDRGGRHKLLPLPLTGKHTPIIIVGGSIEPTTSDSSLGDASVWTAINSGSSYSASTSWLPADKNNGRLDFDGFAGATPISALNGWRISYTDHDSSGGVSPGAMDVCSYSDCSAHQDLRARGCVNASGDGNHVYVAAANRNKFKHRPLWNGHRLALHESDKSCAASYDKCEKIDSVQVEYCDSSGHVTIAPLVCPIGSKGNCSVYIGDD